MPLPNHHSSLGWCVVTFCKYHDGCDGDYQYRQVTTTVCSKKKNITFCYFILRNHHFGNVVGRDWEFWKTDVLIRHFEEWCIWCRCKFFICAMFWDQKTWKDNDSKMSHTGMMGRNFSVRSDINSASNDFCTSAFINKAIVQYLEVCRTNLK